MFGDMGQAPTSLRQNIHLKAPVYICLWYDLRQSCTKLLPRFEWYN
jgi:hypothetical protein